ncbi:hypothetical protein ABL78_5262 [Leptomonas seymouri]|uniref:Uncharacterized protein n=1 Tax=Leptomonas seymouri TaxID=5684 RepID=A0A0N1IJG5_LEPSE|nr:hypothetical protein ABL78_5262 [Leptomonas seymouri]|eukprot:KPI85682.1 hypothetical protein ABL78_5262 [Leptomonas seymouri]
MQPLFHQLLALTGKGSDDSTNCNHGLWNATTEICDCANGWATDWTNQDILGGHMVFCNSQASTPAPGNTSAATVKSPLSIPTRWVLGVAVVAAAVIALGILCFCCCRRCCRDDSGKKHREMEDVEQHRQQQCRLEELRRCQHEGEADRQREVLLRQQMGSPEMQWCLRAASVAGGLPRDNPTNFAAAPTNSQLFSHPASVGQPFTMTGRSGELAELPAFSDPNTLVRCAPPRARYQTMLTEPSLGLYDSDGNCAITGMPSERVYTGNMGSSPRMPVTSGTVGEAWPFASQRHVEPYDSRNPY